MRPYYILSLLALCIAIIVISAAASHESRATDETTRIEVDEANNVIRFFIDGEQKAVLDAEGLHVREDIRYGKQIIDYGQSGFDDHVSEVADAP